jgi:hypothetical protein
MTYEQFLKMIGRNSYSRYGTYSRPIELKEEGRLPKSLAHHVDMLIESGGLFRGILIPWTYSKFTEADTGYTQSYYWTRSVLVQ